MTKKMTYAKRSEILEKLVAERSMEMTKKMTYAKRSEMVEKLVAKRQKQRDAIEAEFEKASAIFDEAQEKQHAALEVLNGNITSAYAAIINAECINEGARI